MAPVALVLGFGPFGEVHDNPARRAALAVDGSVLSLPDGPVRVVGEEMPVSYARAVSLALERAEALDARLILGIGVAVSRDRVEVERLGRRRLSAARPDVDGICLAAAASSSAPELLPARLDVERLARGLSAGISEDAGTYVCNAWLYRVTRAAPQGRAVGFVHVPAAGLPAPRLLEGLHALLAPSGAAG